MAALTALALAASAGSMAYGVYEKSQGADKAEAGYQLQQQGAQIQQQAAQTSANISKAQASASVDYAGQERDLNTTASQQSIAAADTSYGINKDIAASQQNIEAQKKQAMEVDAGRQQLEIIRNQQRSRALALTNATGQGASKGSGLQGGYGQISGQTNTNALGVNQSLQTGEAIFAQNANITQSNLQMADLNHTYAIQQANNQTAKSNLAYNYAVVNAGFQTQNADNQAYASTGAGLIAQGGGQVAQGNAQIASGSSYMQAGQSIFSMGMGVDKLTSGSNFQLSGFNNLFGGSSPSGYGVSSYWNA